MSTDKEKLILRMQQLTSSISILSDEIANTDTMHLHRMEAQSIMRELEKLLNNAFTNWP